MAFTPGKHTTGDAYYSSGYTLPHLHVKYDKDGEQEVDLSGVAELPGDKGMRTFAAENRVTDFVPHWNNEDKLVCVAELVGQDKLRAFSAETRGVETDPKSKPEPESEITGYRVFDLDMIHRLFRAPAKAIESLLRHVFASIVLQPVSSRDYKYHNRKCAIVTIGTPGNVVLGMESFMPHSESEHNDKIVLNHLTKVLAAPYCVDATLVVDLERGCGFGEQHLTKLITDTFDGAVVMTDTDDNPGRFTNFMSKFEMAGQTSELIEQEGVSFSKDLVTESDLTEIFGELRAQMQGYTCHVQKKRDGLPAYKHYVRGYNKEEGNEEKGFQYDDQLVLTFQRSIGAVNEFFKDSKYESYWKPQSN